MGDIPLPCWQHGQVRYKPYPSPWSNCAQAELDVLQKCLLSIRSQGRQSISETPLLQWEYTHLPRIGCWRANKTVIYTGKELAWQPYADVAWKGGALKSLATLSASLSGSLGDYTGLVQRTWLQDLMSAILGCFSLSPTSLPEPILEAVLDTLSGIFTGSSPLREGIMASEILQLTGSEHATLPCLPTGRCRWKFPRGSPSF